MFLDDPAKEHLQRPPPAHFRTAPTPRYSEAVQQKTVLSGHTQGLPVKDKHQTSSNLARDSVHFPPRKQSTKTACLWLLSSDGTSRLDLNRPPAHHNSPSVRCRVSPHSRAAAGRCTEHSAVLPSRSVLGSGITRAVLHTNKRNSTNSGT